MKENLHKAAYDAFFAAIKSTGDAYKSMSWFGRNKVNAKRGEV